MSFGNDCPSSVLYPCQLINECLNVIMVIRLRLKLGKYA